MSLCVQAHFRGKAFGLFTWGYSVSHAFPSHFYIHFKNVFDPLQCAFGIQK